MLKMLERAADRAVGVLVPRATAGADPGCECSSAGSSVKADCYCFCGAGTVGTELKRTCTCDGCHWNCSSTCHDSNAGCICPP
jgi:hypothetical protein